MKSLSAFFVPIFLAAGIRFLTPPEIERAAHGAFEWRASVSCDDPVALLGAALFFSFDFNLDGTTDSGVTTALSPAGCEGGILEVRRPFLVAPALLRAELRTRRVGRETADSVVDYSAASTGGAGALLSLNAFCASPKNGEPEWIEIKNATDRPIDLSKVKLEGRVLAGFLEPGGILAAHAAADTAEMRLWRPGARTFALSSWPGLRNSGDTLRLVVEAKATDGSVRVVMLDTVAYIDERADARGTIAGTARAACASAPTEESGAGAFGYSLQTTGRWRRRAASFDITVTAPDGGTWDLVLYDLDGEEACRLARRAQGPGKIVLTADACPGLPPGATSALILLRPQVSPSGSSGGAPGVRRLLRITP